MRDRRTAEQILIAIGEQQPETIAEAARAVLAAADRLGAVLSEHGAMIARAKAALAKLNARLSAAQQTGTLSFFNSEYRRRRACGACGRRSLHELRPGEAALAPAPRRGGRGDSNRECLAESVRGVMRSDSVPGNALDPA
jgi:hypothetical protein